MRQHLPEITHPAGAVDFLFGVIFNQRVRSEVAWRAPRSLRQRLGQLDIEALAAMDIDHLAEIMARPPALHPFARTMARSIVGTSQVLCDKYRGRAELVWCNDMGSDQLIRRLVEFPGIGDHKADVALFLLSVEYGVTIKEDGRRIERALDRCPRLAELYSS